jgi:hypothetical protein
MFTGFGNRADHRICPFFPSVTTIPKAQISLQKENNIYSDKTLPIARILVSIVLWWTAIFDQPRCECLPLLHGDVEPDVFPDVIASGRVRIMIMSNYP